MTNTPWKIKLETGSQNYLGFLGPNHNAGLSPQSKLYSMALTVSSVVRALGVNAVDDRFEFSTF